MGKFRLCAQEAYDSRQVSTQQAGYQVPVGNRQGAEAFGIAAVEDHNLRRTDHLTKTSVGQPRMSMLVIISSQTRQ